MFHLPYGSSVFLRVSEFIETKNAVLVSDSTRDSGSTNWNLIYCTGKTCSSTSNKQILGWRSAHNSCASDNEIASKWCQWTEVKGNVTNCFWVESFEWCRIRLRKQTQTPLDVNMICKLEGVRHTLRVYLYDISLCPLPLQSRQQ